MTFPKGESANRLQVPMRGPYHHVSSKNTLVGTLEKVTHGWSLTLFLQHEASRSITTPPG